MATFTDTFASLDATRWDEVGGTATVLNGVVSMSAPNASLKVKSSSSDLPTANTQQVSAAFTSLTEGPTAFGIIWIRSDFISSRYGYGLQLIWNADGSRTLNLVKVNYVTQYPDLVDTKTVTLISFDDSDLGVLQSARLQAYDQPDGSTLVRGYLNEDDEALPALEFEDRGTGLNNPPNRSVETYGFAFGAAATLQLDTITATDAYAQPDFGTFKVGHRTLSEIREELLMNVQGSVHTNNSSTVYNAMINQAACTEINKLGDQAMFLRRLELHVAEKDSDGLYLMGHNVERVLDIFDSSSKGPIDYYLVGMTNEGRLRLSLDESPGDSMYVRYMQRYQPMVADTDQCPIPQTYDEIVVLAAALRTVTVNRDKELFAVLAERYKSAFEATRIAMAAYNRQTKGEFFLNLGQRFSSDFKSPVSSRFLPNQW
jgi:hypothetical protein